MKSPRTDGLTWHGPWDFLEVGPFRIAAPLVYSAPGSRVKEPSAVLMDVPLHTLNRPAGHGSARRHQIRAFYRSYEAMGAPDRWEYLDWLAHGRPAGAPHCFFYLHLQGLEKRVLGDHEDLEPIWNELWRVAETNSRDEFTLQYEVRNCLWYLMASSPHIVPEEHVRELSRMLRPINPYDDNEALRRLSLVVWWCATRLKRLPAWLAYHVARTSAETRHTAVSYRTGLEVEQLFASRVPEILGAAAPIDLPAGSSTLLNYHPVNPTLERIRTSWLDPLRGEGWNELEGELVRLLSRCQSDLRPLGTYLGHENANRESAVAWELTPRELRSLEHPARTVILRLGEGRLRQNLPIRIQAGALAEIFEVTARETIAPSVAKRLAASLQSCGFGMEPDSRLTGKGPRWTEEVVLFPIEGEVASGLPPIHDAPEASEEEISRYRACTFVCRLALFVSQTVQSIGRNSLEDLLDRLAGIFAWSAYEQTRYLAFCASTLELGVEPGQLRATVALPLPLKEKVGEFLVDLAVEAGRMGTEQEKALLSAWKRLGLPPRRLQDHLGALSARGIIFVGTFVAAGRGETLHPGPQRSHDHPELKLDHAVIAALLEDTRHVQATLRAAMAEDDEANSPHADVPFSPIKPEPSAAIPNPGGQTDARFKFDSMPARFGRFLSALLQQERWSEDEARDLARTHGVMLSGAVEAINEWTFEEFGSQLIWDEGEILTIDRGLIQY